STFLFFSLVLHDALPISRHFYPFYLLLLSLALYLVGPVLGRMCLIPPHPLLLLLGFLLPPALHPVSLDPLRICSVPLHPLLLLQIGRAHVLTPVTFRSRI